MSTTTSNLGLFKYNVTTDASSAFSITTALNNNWDKIDTGVALKSHTHSGYASSNHTHSNYALTSHTHSGYASSTHTHSDYLAIANSGNSKSITDNGYIKFTNGLLINWGKWTGSKSVAAKGDATISSGVSYSCSFSTDIRRYTLQCNNEGGVAYAANGTKSGANITLRNFFTGTAITVNRVDWIVIGS